VDKADFVNTARWPHGLKRHNAIGVSAITNHVSTSAPMHHNANATSYSIRCEQYRKSKHRQAITILNELQHIWTNMHSDINRIIVIHFRSNATVKVSNLTLIAVEWACHWACHADRSDQFYRATLCSICRSDRRGYASSSYKRPSELHSTKCDGPLRPGCE